METLTLAMLHETRHASGCTAAGPLVALSGQAYQLATRILDSSQGAEDVVQQAYLNAFDHLPAGLPEDEVRTWFFTIVANAAKKHRRGEVRRRKRETAVEPVAHEKDDGRAGGEAVSVLCGAMTVLEEKYRVPIALCYEQSLTQREAAAVLRMPESTVSKYVNIGLAKLRKALERAGYPAAVAAVLGGLKQTAPVVPASLAGRVEALVAKGAGVAKGGGAVAAAAAAAKGGIAMKLIAGVVLAGAVAAGVAVVSGGGGSAPLPAEKPKKFSTPAWHPDARWSATPETYIGSGAFGGPLDGPRLDIVYTEMISTARLMPGYEGAPYGCSSYDPELDRLHMVAGSARGCFDGPFSRARFAGWAYMAKPVCAATPDGRYLFMTEPGANNALRRLDLVEQKVVTLTRPPGWLQFLFADKKGNVYLCHPAEGGRTHVCDVNGKVKKTITLQFPGTPASLFLDSETERLWWSAQFNPKTKWLAGYFDMKAGDGVFHGVVPRAPKRKSNEAGPIKGLNVYPQVWINFGPDDPEKRFLYMTPNDCLTFFRLDLKKGEAWACTKEKDGIRFINAGVPRNINWGTHITAEGDIGTTVPHWEGPRILRYRRVK